MEHSEMIEESTLQKFEPSGNTVSMKEISILFLSKIIIVKTTHNLLILELQLIIFILKLSIVILRNSNILYLKRSKSAAALLNKYLIII